MFPGHRLCQAIALVSTVSGAMATGTFAGDHSTTTKFIVRNRTNDPMTVTAYDFDNGNRGKATQAATIAVNSEATLICTTPVCSVTADYQFDGMAQSYDWLAPVWGFECTVFSREPFNTKIDRCS